jgi:hypothetical protein
MRNSVASMEFGGVLFNNFLNKGNEKGQKRLTTDAFQLATSVLFQNPVQMFGLTPNNLDPCLPTFGTGIYHTFRTAGRNPLQYCQTIQGYPLQHPQS